MLGLCHRTFIGAERLKRGEWIREGGRDLSGKIIGVIGCGNVGKEVVHLLKPFGCVVLVCDIEDRSEFCRDQGVTESSFESLIEKSDIVTLHVPLTDLTRDMINEVIFRKMQANAYLINTSRGPVVNPSALHESLVSGGISGAALDVFCSEPPDDMGFLQLPNLMVTPHIGGNSVEAVEAMGQAAIDNLAEFFEK
jgi:phosphoglycerate dehydrogenase-like enzyme